MHRPYKIMIAGVVEHDATTLATLDQGEIAVLKEDGSLLTAGETISDSASITIVQGTATANSAGTGFVPKMSAKIQGANITKFSGSSYAAAVQAQSEITFASVTAAKDYTIHINFIQPDKELFSERQGRRSFTVRSGASTTVTQLAASFVTLINADPYAKGKVLASNALGVLTIDGVAQTYTAIKGYEVVDFESTLDGQADSLLGDASITSERRVDPGNGLYEQVADKEAFAQGYEGITNRMGHPIPGFPSYAGSGVQYDIYVIDSADVHESSNLEQTVASPIQTIIAVPQASYTGVGALTNKPGAVVEALLNPFMNSTPKAFAALAL